MRLPVLVLALAALLPGSIVALSGWESPRAASAAPARPLPVPATIEAAPTPLAPIAKALSAAEVEANARALRVTLSLDALASRVEKQSHPDALRMAFQAYHNYKAENPGQVRKPYFYYVDYGLDSREPRGYVFDMEALAVVEGPFTVAHGRGSLPGSVGIPTRFTNTPGSATTSLGLYVAQETYGFSGHSGGVYYQSIGLRLKGVSGKFNSRARERGVVVHGAPYVTAAKAGRSEGCPAMEQSRAARLIPMIANGGLVFHFSPVDQGWMQEDPWTPDPLALLASAE